LYWGKDDPVDDNFALLPRDVAALYLGGIAAAYEACIPFRYSAAQAFRSSIFANSSVEACVDSSRIFGAIPASKASFHRLAQRHQRSPGLSPGNCMSGLGVERSLPCSKEYFRNSFVITAQTV
jgi:hypothetical protein